MFHYPHHIGDFHRGTRSLSRLEKWLYRDMIEMYYDTEAPLPLDRDSMHDQLGGITDEYAAIITKLLRMYFTETSSGWHHSRCEIELLKYHEFISKSSSGGKASAEKRRLKAATAPAPLCKGASRVVEGRLKVGTSSLVPTENRKPPRQVQQDNGMSPDSLVAPISGNEESNPAREGNFRPSVSVYSREASVALDAKLSAADADAYLLATGGV